MMPQPVVMAFRAAKLKAAMQNKATKAKFSEASAAANKGAPTGRSRRKHVEQQPPLP